MGKLNYINYILLKKKTKRKNPADIMLTKACVNSFCLLPCMKLKCRQKFWLGVQFCRLLHVFQLQYLQISSMLISGGNFINNNFTLFCIGAIRPYEFSKDRSPRAPGSQGSTPRSNPSAFYYFWQKTYPFGKPSIGNGTPFTCLV